MSAQIHAITHGPRSFELAYTLVLLTLIAGLIHARASWGKFLVAPLVAGPAMLLAVLVASMAAPVLAMLNVARDSVPELVFGAIVFATVGYVAGRTMAGQYGDSRDPQHRRGAMVMFTQPHSRRRRGTSAKRRLGKSTTITIAGVPLGIDDEMKHFKLIGTTGTGKSTAMHELLSGALGRGDRAIIADPDGGYLDRVYDPSRGDVILNPFDSHARKWNPFGEIANDYDVNQLARSLIPDGGDPDRIWCEFARTFFTAVMKQTIRAGKPDDRELFRLLKSAERDELRVILAGTPAGPFLEEGNEKMFGSLRSVAISAVEALEYTTQQEAAPLSVRQWVREGAPRNAGGPGGVLFLPYTAGQIAALRSLISAWMRLAIFQAMDRGEGDQRLWFFIDEVDALGEIDGLKDALARLRKFGGRVCIGLQSIAQMSGTYGRGTAHTIVENCGNTVIFRCSASENGGTSEFASKLIGQREVLHTTVSRSRRALQWLSSITTSQHLKIEPAVMASEIERLPDLTGFLKVASVPDWQWVALTPFGDLSAPRFAGPNGPTRWAAAATIPKSPPVGVASATTHSPTQSAPPTPPELPEPVSPPPAANDRPRKSRASPGRAFAPKRKSSPKAKRPSTAPSTGTGGPSASPSPPDTQVLPPIQDRSGGGGAQI